VGWTELDMYHTVFAVYKVMGVEVMGIPSVLKALNTNTLAATWGPSATVWLTEEDHFWIAFVAAGVLRVTSKCGLREADSQRSDAPFA